MFTHRINIQGIVHILFETAMTIDQKKGMFLSISAFVLVAMLVSCSAIRNAPIPIIDLSTETAQPVAATATPSPTATYTPTPTATFTATTTQTVTPIPKLFTISFHAWHDFNGNGELDEGEPELEGIHNRTNAGECTTRADGKCEIPGVPSGKNIWINTWDKREVERYEKMNYKFPSLSEVLLMGQGFSTVLEGNQLIEEPLGQGYFTLPLPCGPYVVPMGYFDLDPSQGVINYLGQRTNFIPRRFNL